MKRKRYFCLLIIIGIINGCKPNVQKRENIAVYPKSIIVKPITLLRDDGMLPVELFHSRSLSNRNVVSYDGQLFIFGVFFIEDGVLHDRNDVLCTDDGRIWKRIADRFLEPERLGYSVLIGNEHIIIEGGEDSVATSSSGDAYRSDLITIDSKNATIAKVDEVAFRKFAALVFFKGDLYIIGGAEKTNPVSTVLKVSNGKVARIATIPGTGNSGLERVQAWVSGGSIYVTNCDGMFWTSADGLKWKIVEMGNSFPSRGGYVVIPRDDDLYIAGGIAGSSAGLFGDDAGLCNDVWKSSDNGKNWELISIGLDAHYLGSPGAGKFGFYDSFPARQDCIGLVFKGRLIIGGGRDSSGYRQDFWISDDGVHWHEIKQESIVHP